MHFKVKRMLRTRFMSFTLVIRAPFVSTRLKLARKSRVVDKFQFTFVIDTLVVIRSVVIAKRKRRRLRLMLRRTPLLLITLVRLSRLLVPAILFQTLTIRRTRLNGSLFSTLFLRVLVLYVLSRKFGVVQLAITAGRTPMTQTRFSFRRIILLTKLVKTQVWRLLLLLSHLRAKQL